MRLIGNKTKLLSNIEELLTERGVEGGTLIDIFAGTSSVGRHFKERGFRVVSNDLLASCYVQAGARVEVSKHPKFASLRKKYRQTFEAESFRDGMITQGNLFDDAEDPERQKQALARRPLAEAVNFLNACVEPREGLIARSFCPSGPAARQYLTDDNGRKIDGILEFLRTHREDETLSHAEFHVLLASLIDAADRVANISGTYGAFLKKFQSSALRPLTLTPVEVGESDERNKAYQEDGNELVRRVRGDVLYIDPPYNRRQYGANYHVLEIIARYHQIDDLAVFEESLYGKTGLRPYDDVKSSYCVPPGARSRRRSAGGTGETEAQDVAEALRDLVLSSKASHVVISYSEEGLLSRDEIGGILARFSGKKAFDYDRDFIEVRYKRFRSDRDRSASETASSNGTNREYRVLEGRDKDELCEWLFYASRKPGRGAGGS